jgi:hypothetical protein
MGKISIKKSDLDRIIKEEALKFKKAFTLKKELANIQEQLKQLNEVEAGANEAPTGGDNLTAAETQFVKNLAAQKAPKFHNPSKNPNTMMEDDEDIEDVDTDIDTDVDSEMDTDGDTIDKSAVLNAIEDLKMALNLHGASEEGEGEEVEANGDVDADDTEFEFDGDDETEEAGDDVVDGEEESGESEEGVEAESGIVENLEEPIEGGSVVQNADEDDVNDNMKKDTLVKAAGDTLMESEKRRMAVLAGIMKG